MHSFRSDFEGGANNIAHNSPNVLLVSELNLESASDLESDKTNRNKKVVPGVQMRRRQKVAGDGVVFREQSLKGKKYDAA